VTPADGSNAVPPLGSPLRDKGIVIAGDIRVNLLDIELLTIKIRLIVASVDRAREMGIDWWEHDSSLSPGRQPIAGVPQTTAIPPATAQSADVVTGPVLDPPTVVNFDG